MGFGANRKMNKTELQKNKNSVKVWQTASARTGQGGNAFAINASDVGVVRTDIQPGKK